jgi:hypothetical protein
MVNAVRWILLGAALAGFVLFAIPNWSPVTLRLGRYDVLIQLPILLLLTFLLGLLPTWGYHRALRASWRRRLAKAETPLPAPLPPASPLP